MTEFMKIEERRYDYRNIECKIIKSSPHEGKYIYNTYIFLSKKKNEEFFEKYILPIQEKDIARYTYDYMELDIPFNCGITFYERIFNQKGECMGIEIGNDYNHKANEWKTFEDVKQDLEDVVDFLTSNI